MEIGASWSSEHQMQENLTSCAYYDNVSKQYKDSISVGPAVTTIFSSFFSLLGSLLIIITFVAFKEVRTVGRAILVFLAFADFFTALGYMFGAGVYLHYRPKLENEPPNGSYITLCKVQSFVTTFFPISSFLWTTNLAVYFFVAIVLRKVQVAKKMIVVFHIMAWGIPLLICIPAVATNTLGPAESRSSASWCWVAFDPHQPDKLVQFYVMEVVCGKFWEIMTYLVALSLCLIVKYTIFKRNHSLKTESETTYGYSSIEKKMKAAFYHVDQILLWIPFVFLLVRLWGSLRFFVSLVPACHGICDGEVVVFPGCYKVLYHPALVYLQSIGDPGQGWSNALLFVIFHKPIAMRLFPCWFTHWQRLSNSCRYCAHDYMVCRFRWKPVPIDDSPPHCSPDNSKSFTSNDDDPMITKKKSTSKTSFDNSSVLYCSSEHDKKAPVTLAGERVSINKSMD